MSQRVDIGDKFVDVAVVESTPAEAVATQTQLFVSNQMLTLVRKQTGVISVNDNMSHVNTFTVNHDSCLTL